ncbi:hypothetical protein [uncultured Nostoc sp.]|uniref:hypothetical protein n=1 Tax=uncultured Nostoc sp. TaxID=340711 RepID=UPI00261120E9|nr:hypothetical protein [uncultured Nostoc sp.]
MPQLVAQPPQRFVTVTFDDLPVITDRDGDAVKLDTTNKLLASITKNKSVDFSVLAHTCDRVTQIPISN